MGSFELFHLDTSMDINVSVSRSLNKLLSYPQKRSTRKGTLAEQVSRECVYIRILYEYFNHETGRATSKIPFHSISEVQQRGAHAENILIGSTAVHISKMSEVTLQKIQEDVSTAQDSCTISGQSIYVLLFVKHLLLL